MLPSKPETNTTVKPITKLLLLTFLMAVGKSVLLAADRGTLVRDAVIYLSPDTTSNKLAQVERGRELILLDKSHNWLHVEALLGMAQTPDPAFVLDDEDQGKTISGWVLDNGVVWASTPPWTPRRSPGRLAPLSPRLRCVPDLSAGRRRPLSCGGHSMADRKI